MDKTKIDLNAPAFGPNAQKLADLEETVPPVVTEEPKVEEKKVEEAAITEPVEEENSVRYSRFKKFHDEALALREEVAELRRKVEVVKPAEQEVVVPDSFKRLYGDENSPHWESVKEAWKIQSEQNEALVSRARQEAIEAARSERYEEIEKTNKNLQTIDSGIESLSDTIGRDLTDAEQSSVLDIVDAYTPQDANGNYLGPLLPFDKAWEIYELKQNVQKAPKKESKDNVAALSGKQSQGEPANAEKNASWNPMDWNAWQKRI